MPNLGNSPGIDTRVRDGKVYLSIDDPVALTLENNLDLDVARYNLNTAHTAYPRAKCNNRHRPHPVIVGSRQGDTLPPILYLTLEEVFFLA